MKNIVIVAIVLLTFVSCQKETKQPNIIFVYADEWRAQAVGYAGNSQVITPNIDQLAEESINPHCSYTSVMSWFVSTLLFNNSSVCHTDFLL